LKDESRVNLILSADLKLGEYSSSTHIDYMRLSQSRWTQMLAIVSQMSSSTEHQVVKSLVSLAYEVRHSTSFRTMLQHLTWRGRGDVFSPTVLSNLAYLDKDMAGAGWHPPC
jgi:hypothetical protein